MNGVIEIATGDLLMWGPQNFTADTGQEVRTDVPEPSKRKRQLGEIEMHRWTGADWILVNQPVIPGERVQISASDVLLIAGPTETELASVRFSRDSLTYGFLRSIAVVEVLSETGDLRLTCDDIESATQSVSGAGLYALSGPYNGDAGSVCVMKLFGTSVTVQLIEFSISR